MIRTPSHPYTEPSIHRADDELIVVLGRLRPFVSRTVPTPFYYVLNLVGKADNRGGRQSCYSLYK